MKKLHPLRSKNKILSSKVDLDSKLSQASLILEYAFGYNVNLKERVITISREIDEAEFDRIDNGLTELEAQSRKAVTIRINSPGGEVYQALAIIGRLKRSPCKIVTEGYGHVMSAATLILASGDSRKLSKFAFFMHHEMSYEIEGKHSDIKNEVAQAEKEERIWAQWMSEMSNKTPDFWIKIGSGKNAYFTPEELKKLGVIDEIF